MNKIALTLAMLSLAGAAAASDRPVFRWAPEDLTTLERVALTHERVEEAARDFCQAHVNGTRGLRQWRACITAVEDEIVASVGDQRLTAYAETGTVDAELLAGLTDPDERT